jgi:hypothetical protein
MVIGTCKSIKAFDVYFKNVSPEAYERPSFGYQATNEIVQHLVQKGFIERDTLEYIKLTQEGLDKCKDDVMPDICICEFNVHIYL